MIIIQVKFQCGLKRILADTFSFTGKLESQHQAKYISTFNQKYFNTVKIGNFSTFFKIHFLLNQHAKLNKMYFNILINEYRTFQRFNFHGVHKCQGLSHSNSKVLSEFRQTCFLRFMILKRTQTCLQYFESTLSIERVENVKMIYFRGFELKGWSVYKRQTPETGTNKLLSRIYIAILQL